MQFYKISDGAVYEGSGVIVPEGFTTYEAGQEPADLLEARKPRLEVQKAQKLQQINTTYEQAMDYLRQGYPPSAILGWNKQEAEAKELLSDPEAPAAYVRTMSARKGVNVMEQAGRILNNAASWAYVAGLLEGERQVLEEAVLLATSPEEVDAVQIIYSV